MDIFAIASLIGTIAFALSGFLIGVRKRLDVMGVFILAMLTGNGGGAVRDVLVGRQPAVLTDVSAFLIVFATIGVALLLKLHKRDHIEKSQIFILCDAVGLAAFSVTGALVGIAEGLSIFGVMVLAFIAATGGGIIRDLMVNEVPAVLSSDFYGTIALYNGVSLYLLHYFNLHSEMAITVVFSSALVLRLLAYRFGWRLPHIPIRTEK